MFRSALVAALLLASPNLFAAGPAVGDAAPAVTTKDIKGREVVVPAPGKVMVLALVAKATGEKAGEVTKEVRVAHPDVEVVTFIDASGFPGFLGGMVKSKISGRHDQAVKDNNEAFKKAGKTPPEDMDKRVHLVPVMDGKIVQNQYGAKDTDKQAHFVVVGADGKIAATFDKTPTAADVNAALDKLPK